MSERIRKVNEETMKSKSQTVSLVKGQAEDLKRFAEANGVNIVIVMADQKCFEPDAVAMCQMGHVPHRESDLSALHALYENIERAKEVLEGKIMHKMIELKDAGKLDIKLSKEEARKLEEIKTFFNTIKGEEIKVE